MELSGLHQPYRMSPQKTSVGLVFPVGARKRPQMHFFAPIPPSLSTKDNAHPSPQLRPGELADLIMANNELNLPAHLRGQWSPLLQVKERKKETESARLGNDTLC